MARRPIGRTDLSLTLAHPYSRLQLPQHVTDIPSDAVVMHLIGPKNSVRIDQKRSPQGDSPLILEIDTECSAERAGGVSEEREVNKERHVCARRRNGEPAVSWRRRVTFLPARPEPAETGSFPMAVRGAPEQSEKAARGLFQHPVRARA